MTYRFRGLEPSQFDPIIGLGDEELARQGAVRMIADSVPGFPCRIRLDDAAVGESLILVNHVSHEGNNPYRASHAIFVGEQAREAACYEDAVPPALDRRILSLRAFGADGMMVDATLAQPGETDRILKQLLSDPAVDHVDAHTAIRGCFLARAERN